VRDRIKERAKLIRPLIIPLFFYIILIAFSMNWLPKNPDSPFRVGIALLPMIPGIVIAIGIYLAIMKLDELERKILMDGIIFSFILTLILVTSLGLLSFADVPMLNGSYISLLMMVFWLIGKLIGNWRHK